MYLIDTSALLAYPECLSDYVPNVIVLEVLEELDRLKTARSDKGFLARQAIRTIKNKYKSEYILPSDLKGELYPSADKKFIETVKINPSKYTIITSDLSLYLQLKILGGKAIFLESKKEIPTHYFEVYLSDTDFEKFYNDDKLRYTGNLNNNTYGIVKKAEGNSLLAFYSNYELQKVKLTSPKNTLLRHIMPLTNEQSYLMDAIYYKRFPLTIVTGVAGSGKTLVSLYLGLNLVLDNIYDTLVALQAPIHVGGVDKIGFWKGTKDDKLSNYFGGVHDSLDFITKHDWEETIKDKIEFDSITLVRGRSYRKKFILVDEAQNITPLELLTILTRVGEDSQIVLLGDLDQIDTNVSWEQSGLGLALLTLSDSKYATHINMQKTHRSKVVQEAIEKITPFVTKRFH